MSLIKLPSLPDPILHLICLHLTPDRASVNDPVHGQSHTLYRAIINLSLTAHALSRISTAHIATNLSLTHASLRWTLFLRSARENPAYAAGVRYLRLVEDSSTTTTSSSSSSVGELEKHNGAPDEVTEMFEALRGLETLFSSSTSSAAVPRVGMSPASIIIQRLVSREMGLWKTLRVLRFEHVDARGDESVVELSLVRQRMGKDEEREEEKGMTKANTTGLLMGKLDAEDVARLRSIPEVSGVQVGTCGFGDEGGEEGCEEWVDEEDDDDDGEARDDDDSDDDYEYESGSSDWDSEDESDYEDDWEAEYSRGFVRPS